jgi:hypothetical protein
MEILQSFLNVVVIYQLTEHNIPGNINPHIYSYFITDVGTNCQDIKWYRKNKIDSKSNTILYYLCPCFGYGHYLTGDLKII